jgi:hypothetical protein
MQIDLAKPAINISTVEENTTHVVYCRLTETV